MVVNSPQHVVLLSYNMYNKCCKRSALGGLRSGYQFKSTVVLIACVLLLAALFRQKGTPAHFENEMLPD